MRCTRCCGTDSLGVIAFELLTGARPYSARTAYEWILIHNQATPPDLQLHGVPPQLARIVKRMLSRNPAQRQQTMREVVQDLRTAGRAQKNIPAFASEGAAAAGGHHADHQELGDATQSVAGRSPPAPQPPTYQAPLQISTPPPTFQPPPPAPQPSAPVPMPQPGYQPSALAPQYGYQQSAPPSYQPTPYQSPPPDNRAGRAQLRRIGEFALGAAVVVIYLIVYWQDTLAFLHNFAQSLRFGM